MKIFNEYINEVAKVKDELEHSGRTFLQNLLTEFTNTHKINIIHESKRDKKGRGAPDFKFLFNDTEIGYLENKKIGIDLDEWMKEEKEPFKKDRQFSKYKTLTDNLIATDYLRWIWIYKDTIKEVRLCEKTELSNKTIKLSEQNCNDLRDLINDFLSQKPQEIVKARDLAEKLSKPTRTIKEEINDIVTDSESDKTSRIIGTYKVFKAEISENITPEDFADAFAQTLTYSLFLTKITLTSSEKLTLSNIANLTPKSFALIKDILAFINEIEDYPQLKPYIEMIFHIINHTNAFEVVSDLQNNKDEFEDAYIHFYENFLTAYDKEKRKELGVWYTPKPVVRSIINNIHEILKEDFNLADGLADESVKLLDFACGTGTFLFEVYDKILSEISKTSLKRAGLIKNHILKNIFGFELLIPAYCVSHLKLSQHLKDEGYALEKDDRIRVYFTNTLENRHPDRQQSLGFENFFPAIAREGKEAQQIKDDKSILVITGNPPYNAKSKNVLERELLEFHEGYKCDDETNSKSIQDDYVKFIAFAHRKIKLAGRGVFGLIVNNSFLSGLTHRKMRNELMKDFDKIYIINLHGGGEINGIKDENVFAIKQNVCIAIFVKNDKIKDKGVFQTDLIGKRLEKFKTLPQLDRKSFEKLEIDEFNKAFKSTNWGKNRFKDNLSFFYPMREAKAMLEYGKFVGLTDIFGEYTSGIKTADDKNLISFKEDEFKKKIDNFDKQFVKNISYRPFDNRKIYYDTKLVERPRLETMQHMFQSNIALISCRLNDRDSMDHFFASSYLSELKTATSTTGSYHFPLYLHKNDLEGERKEANFKPEFAKMIAEKFEKPTPEEVLGYIYAVLHSQTYRTKYLEFLKIDFPRIPFDCDKTSFKKLADIGQELIDAHLMRKIPKSKIGETDKDELSIKIPSNETEEQKKEREKKYYIVEKTVYNEKKQRMYLNKVGYFADVSHEVWNFKIGGYQVLKQYLEGGKSTSRKGIDISSDLTTIENIIKVLDFTIGKMGEIDNCILLV
jgi:predicted helicase